MELFYTFLGLLVAFLGFLSAWVVSGRKKKFSWLGYWLLVAGLIGNLIIYFLYFGFPYLVFFLVGMVFGWLFEVSWGFVFHICFGEKLWSYHLFPLLGGYVTFMTFPFWGFATILFIRILELFHIFSL